MMRGVDVNSWLAPLGVELRRPGASPVRDDMARCRKFAWFLGETAPLPGVVVEAGVGAGWGLRTMGWLAPERQLIGYDYFGNGPWKTTVEQVSARLRRAGVRATLVRGPFEETLPHHSASIAFLHLDANRYESTACALTRLWPHVLPRGIVRLDDYGHAKWPGVARAVAEFGVPVRHHAHGGAYLRKESP